MGVITTSDKTKVVLIIVFVSSIILIGAGAVAYQHGVINFASENSYDSVPNESTIVVFYDNSVLRDRQTRNVLDNINSHMKNTSGESIESSISDFESETGLKIRHLNHVTIFGSSTAIQDRTKGYFGVIVSARWNEKSVVNAVKERNMTDLNKKTKYRGHTIYVFNSTDTANDRLYVGVLKTQIVGENLYVIGTEKAVKDSIKTHDGDKEPISGDVRHHLTRRDSFITFAIDVPDTYRERQTSVQRDVEVVSGHYYTNKTNMTVELFAQMRTSKSANQTKKRLILAQQLWAGNTADDRISNEIYSIEIKTDKNLVSAKYETSDEELNSLIDYYFTDIRNREGNLY